MLKIYCIEDCDGLKYIGSTIQPLNERLSKHRWCKDCMSRELNLDDCKIYTLEECEEEQRKEREQYWIDNTKCVNKYNTIFNKKEDNKKRYQQNKDNIIEYMKKYNKLKNTWGGDPRYYCNLLKIDPFLFSLHSV